MTSDGKRRCEFEGCGREFTLPADAPHKRFCCAKHREAWHHAQRQLAMALLRKAKGQPQVAKSASDLGL